MKSHTFMNVSIIIPAHNSAETLSETLKSLQAQTLPHWEGIIINDGSTDDTVTIAEQFTSSDPRFRLLNQPQSGVSAARNTGISQAQFDWLLFLDSDDWISPHFLERMTAPLKENPSLDAVHCGWSRITTEGSIFCEKYAPSATDLFPVLARCCPFAIHACIARKTLIEEVGGFDPHLITCEEWDLWQRIARKGAKFALVKEIMAFYPMRSNSLSRKGEQFFQDAIRVVTQGHSADPRVVNPHPDYVQGFEPEKLPQIRLLLSSWLVGFGLAEGKDVRYLLNYLPDALSPDLDPTIVADNIFESVPLAHCLPHSQWPQLWPKINGVITDFLVALENKSQSVELARRSQFLLESLILKEIDLKNGLTIGRTYGTEIEITEQLSDLEFPVSIERLYLQIAIMGEKFGALELPVIDGKVTAWVLEDAIAAYFYWQILQQFFKNSFYSPEEAQKHNQIGWTVFLQQLWGKPDWGSDRFYDGDFREETPSIQDLGTHNRLILEVSQDLFDVTVRVPEVDVIVTVGGVAISSISLPVTEGYIHAQQLRVAINLHCGVELAQACVREALIGQSFGDKIPLRQRLAASAQEKNEFSQEFIYSQSSLPIKGLWSSENLILGRYGGSVNSAVSRRVMLPVGVADELLTLTQVTHEPVIQIPPPGTMVKHIIYTPDVIAYPYQSPSVSVAHSGEKNIKNIYDRQHFESLFSRSPDPWKYTSPYEQTKYEQTLSLLPNQRLEKALEIGCAEGHFTVQLAPKVGQLTVTDISQVALERTADRCRPFNYLTYQQLDLIKDPLPGQFNLIVCSEILYFMGGLEQLKAVAQKIADALEPGGYFLTAHAHQIIDEPDKPGFDWGLYFGAKTISDTFEGIDCLYLAKEIRTPLYRVQLFRRYPEKSWPWEKFTPKITILDQQPAPLPPEVEAYVKWEGGQSSPWAEVNEVKSEKLPILMYHRIAPVGNSTMSRYRVTPEAFEEQLRYLQDAGYYSVSWEQWELAQAQKTPLLGRGIIITFDDGYQDFFDYAWPLLKQYGFTATVFLVSERIGQTNLWDAAFGEELPLMGWPKILQLQQEGVEFGSHGATHAPLTALSVENIVREGVRSRQVLERGLKRPVKTIAYPYGDFNPIVEHLIGGCGYTFGVTCRSGLSQFNDRLLALPRIEVMGDKDLQTFVKGIVNS